MTINKSDIVDVINEWADDKLLSWQSKVEEAIVEIAQIMQTEENISTDTKKALQSVIDMFYEKK